MRGLDLRAIGQQGRREHRHVAHLVHEQGAFAGGFHK
jgi:hypothetical protein